MEVDTGSTVSIISVFRSYWNCNVTRDWSLIYTYSDEQLSIKGKVTCEFSYKGQTYTLPLIVLAGEDNHTRPWLDSRNLTRLFYGFSGQSCERWLIINIVTTFWILIQRKSEYLYRWQTKDSMTYICRWPLSFVKLSFYHIQWENRKLLKKNYND